MKPPVFQVQRNGGGGRSYYSATTSADALEYAARDGGWGSHASACAADPETWAGVAAVQLKENAGLDTAIAWGVEALTCAADGWGTLYRLGPPGCRLLRERLARVVQHLAKGSFLCPLSEFVTIREAAATGAEV